MSTPTAERSVRLDVPPELIARYRALRARKAEIDAVNRTRYLRDPDAWAAERLGIRLWSKQREIMALLLDNPRVAVRSCHASGKTFSAAVLALWWVDVHPPGDAIVVSTAPSHEQVHAVLWEQIRTLHNGANLPGVVQRSDRWLIDGKMVGIGRRPPDHQESAFQGIHRKYVLAILDEAGGIPAWLWTGVDAITTGVHCRTLAIGNPDDSSSEFAKVCLRDPGWAKVQISAFDTPAFTGEDVPPEVLDHLVSPEWVADKALRWGETNPLYQAKVLAEFADSEDGLIPLSWVRAAHARWHAWRDAGSPEVGGRRIIGVDVARYGTDATCLAIREGDVIREIAYHSKLDTVEVATLVEAQLAFPASQAVVDVIGVGAGVVDLLRHRRKPVIAFNAAMRTGRRDTTGSWKFPNVRSASYWNLRELLDPSAGATLALPDDDDLTADLITPTWRIGTGNTVIVESKDEIRKRLGRSTDAGDAVAMAMWVNPSTGRAPAEGTERRRPRAVAYADSVTWR